jgi:hypothetical protein
MRLSDAIREGAKKRPQATGELFRLTTIVSEKTGEERRVMGSCALGAAYEAVKGLPRRERRSDLSARHVQKAVNEGLDLSALVIVPRESYRGGKETLENTIVILNDEYGWSREDIADWLDTILDEHNQLIVKEAGVSE